MTTPGPIPPTGPTSVPTGAGGVPSANVPLSYEVAPTFAPTQDEKTMAMLAHLLGIIGFLGPLIIWLIKKDQSPFVNDQGKEALNFHLTLLIGIVIGLATMFICIGAIITPAVWLVGVIFSILGAMKAKDGITYRYPFAIRFIK